MAVAFLVWQLFVNTETDRQTDRQTNIHKYIEKTLNCEGPIPSSILDLLGPELLDTKTQSIYSISIFDFPFSIFNFKFIHMENLS
jgi:hypothetical protein